MTSNRKICILTVHGVGFQQPPDGGTPGYADGLHQHIGRGLGAGHLGDDPLRKPGPYGPVYVMSAKPGTRDREWGLSRLGTWRDGGASIDVADAPLTAGDEPFAHVAVIYNPLEGIGPRPATAIGVTADAGLVLGRYASVTGVIRLVAGDVWAALHEHGTAGTAPAGQSETGPLPSLRPRDDVAHGRRPLLAGLRRRPAEPANPAKPAKPAQPGGSALSGVVRTLEDDVLAYICRNDLRESIREFIAEALRRLAARPDVEHVVINAHSQGTVVAFDVLRDYPAAHESPVRALVTAGSPLRKYADLFSWGNDAGGIQTMTWVNFWDEKDPVGDPLDPPPGWHFGDPPVREPGQLGLLWATDARGVQVQVPITDHRVDNLHNSPGTGLLAHNYWGNTKEVIPALCDVLKTLFARTAVK